MKMSLLACLFIATLLDGTGPTGQDGTHAGADLSI